MTREELRQAIQGDLYVLNCTIPPYVTTTRAIVEFDNPYSGTTANVYVLGNNGERKHRISVHIDKIDTCTREDKAKAVSNKMESLLQTSREYSNKAAALEDAINRLRKFKTDEEDIDDAISQIQSAPSFKDKRAATIKFIMERAKTL